MRRALLVSVVGAGLACGGGEGASHATPVEPADGEANRPPYVEAISILPERPSTEDALSVGLRVIDPDRDPLSIEVTWYRNGAVHDDGGRQSIDPGEFSRDDSVWVDVVISDGSEQVAVSTDPVSIRNAPPRAASIRITPPGPSAADILEVEVEGGDADGDPVRWSYRWLVDGQPLESASSPRLAPGKLKRGSRVAIEVSGNDGVEDGDWIASEEVAIGNAAPRITTQPVYGLASPGRYVYEVKAEDADADEPLRYELAEGPPGMSIDLVSGVVTWPVPTDASGSYPVEIGVSDAHGGRAVQRWSLEVSWEPESEDAPSRGKQAAASAESDADTSSDDSEDSASEPADDDDELSDEDADF